VAIEFHLHLKQAFAFGGLDVLRDQPPFGNDPFYPPCFQIDPKISFDPLSSPKMIRGKNRKGCPLTAFSPVLTGN